jgi:hypothetical protein
MDTSGDENIALSPVAIHGGIGAGEHFATHAAVQANIFPNYSVSLDFFQVRRISFIDPSEGTQFMNLLLGYRPFKMKGMGMILFVGSGLTRNIEMVESGSNVMESSYEWGLTFKGQFHVVKGSFLGMALTPFVNLTGDELMGGVDG